MHGLKKTGITIVAGGLIGASATAALGASELYGVGDMGNFNSPMPDGNADGIFINTLFNTIDVVYYDNNGLNIVDTGGQMVDVLVATAGSGYGNGNVSANPAGVNKWMTNDSPLAALGMDDYPAGWFVQATINSNGTGGTGAVAYYELDGPAGGYFYAGGRTRYDTGNPNARYYDSQNFGMIDITSGGTGYAVGANGNGQWDSATANDATGGATAGGTNWNRQGSLLITASGAGIGSFGIPVRTQNDAANFDPTAAGPRDILRGGHNPAVLEGIGAFGLNVVRGTNASMWIINDNITWTAANPNNKNGEDQYGNYRLYLGTTPAPANGNYSYMTGWDIADSAGEVANLDIIQNSTTQDGNPNNNGTSGIGYSAGTFTVYNAAGEVVDGITISYEVDAEGRVYTDGLGTFFRGPLNANVSPVTGGPNSATIASNWNATSGWTITNAGSGHSSSAGWTVMPANSNNGFGFDCKGVHLYGQIVQLPYLACQTNENNTSWDVTGVPTLAITTGGTGADAAMIPGAAADGWDYYAMDVPSGEIINGYVLNNGQSYTTVTDTWVTTAAGDSGTGGVLQGVIGGVGRRTITMDGEDVSTDLFNNGFKCYMNGDFNGDGYSDLLWHSDTAEITAIWNMGPEGSIKSAGFLTPEGMGPGWALSGIGKFGYSGTGCCIFWNNIFDGQTAVWVVDSSPANEVDWVVGGVFLDTVELLTNTPRVTNNVVQNGGTGIYWQDDLFGQLAYWPIAVNTNISGASLSGAGFITLDGVEILFTEDFGIDLAGVGNMAGRPVSQGTSSLRDIVSVNEITGETLIWLMSSDHTSIDTAAVGNTGATGGGYATRFGLITFDNFYNFEGIGQYNVNAIYALTNGTEPLPGGTSRQTWFANLFWSYPDLDSNFSWKMDRNVDLIDYRVDPTSPTGTGLSVDPYEITGTAPLD